MIVMALDHTRDFFHAASFSFQPEDLTRTTAAIFFTRWITHFCAPVFMLTAGMGAYFLLQKTGDKKRLSAFLLKRGLWLIVLDLTVVRFALTWGQGPLAFVGSTGNANPANPHLHFEIHRLEADRHWYQGISIDPYPYLVNALRSAK